MHAIHRTTTLSSGLTISYPCQRLSFAKVPTLYLLILVLSIFQSFGQHGILFCEAMLPCQPIPPCWSCEVKWLPNVINPSIYTLCVNGRAYRGLCRNKGVFSFRLKCCVPSWDKEWKGCAGELFIESSTTMPTDLPKNYTGKCIFFRCFFFFFFFQQSTYIVIFDVPHCGIMISQQISRIRQ